MKKLGDGRGKTIVSPTTRQIADGEITDLSDWDVQELMMGRRRDKNGKFRGKPPKLIPLKILHELNRRQGRKAMTVFMDHLVKAAETICEIAERKKPREGDLLRLKAASAVVERILGRPSESIMLGIHAASDDDLVLPWQRLMATSIISTEYELEAGDIEEGELVEEPEPKPIKRVIKRPARKRKRST